MKFSGVIIVRIRESLPPDFINQAVSQTVALLQADEFKNAVVIVEENRFRRRVLSQP